MHRLVAVAALAWLLVVGPDCRPLAKATGIPGTRGGTGDDAVAALQVDAAGLYAVWPASKPSPSPEQGAQTLAVLGGRLQQKRTFLGRPGDSGGDRARALLLRSPRPQRGPPSPAA